MSVRTRLARLEANQRPEPPRPWATFLCGSVTDIAAIEQAEKAAHAEGRDIMVIRLVAPTMDASGKAIKTGATRG